MQPSLTVNFVIAAIGLPPVRKQGYLHLSFYVVYQTKPSIATGKFTFFKK